MATADTVLAVYADSGGVGRQSTGKPDELEMTPVRFGEGAAEKYRATATRRCPTLPYVRFCEGLGVKFPGPTRQPLHIHVFPQAPYFARHKEGRAHSPRRGTLRDNRGPLRRRTN